MLEQSAVQKGKVLLGLAIAGGALAAGVLFKEELLALIEQSIELP